MRCPFRYRRRERFLPGCDPDFMDFIEERDDRAEAAFNARFPSCWAKFLHWIGWRD
jgi:hypothetical protein